MMARYPGSHGVRGLDVADRGRYHSHCACARARRIKSPPRTWEFSGGTVVFFGADPKTGQRFVTQSIEGGGWGGTAVGGWRVCGRLGVSGRRAQCPIEKMELRWPIRVQRRQLRQRFRRPRQVPRRAWDWRQR